MNNAKETKLETLSNRCSSAIARIETKGDSFHAAAIDAEIEMSIILARDKKLAKRWAEVMQYHHEAIAAV